jgi:CrcB protein
MERGETLAAAAYVAGSVVLSVLGLFLGLWAMRAALG